MKLRLIFSLFSLIFCLNNTVAQQKTVVFLGNKNISPILYKKGNTCKGIVIDIVQAMKTHMVHKPEIQLINWQLAQKKVKNGEADALLQINTSSERLKDFDFSEKLLKSEFTIFIKSNNCNIKNLNDLMYLNVGVESKGCPTIILNKHKKINSILYSNIEEAFIDLDNNKINAVITDKWVGLYILAIKKYYKIKTVAKPVEVSYSRIAVKKGNKLLLSDINRALKIIKKNGEFDKIIEQWSNKDVVYLMKEKITQYIYIIASIFILIISFIFYIKIKNKKRNAKLLEHNIELDLKVIDRTKEINIQYQKLLALNQKLNIAKEKAEESDKLKTEFINNMSHEIRTPMNGILGFSELLNNEDLCKENRKNYINIIQNCGNQLMNVIDDILEISCLETKQVKTQKKPICLNDILIEKFSFFDIKAKENKTDLHIKKGLTDIDSTIITDETKLNKILHNLIENALKFTTKGFIEFGYYLTQKADTQQIIIYVKDSGIGIIHEKHNSIFERFTQDKKELSNNIGGLGLGLSIAKENAKLLEGTITLKSEKGKGSIFYLTIPYTPAILNTKI